MRKLYEQLRDEKGLKDADIARIAGVSKPTISQWKREMYNLKYENLQKIASALGVSTDYLLNGLADSTPVTDQGIKIPILGYVAAGIPIAAITDVIGEVTISKHTAQKGEHFALKIKGDSMEPDMKQGDVVIVRLQPEAESGDTIIAQVDGNEATCKKFRFVDGGIILQSMNPKYDPMFFSADQVQTLPVKIIGKVIEVRRFYE